MATNGAQVAVIGGQRSRSQSPRRTAAAAAAGPRVRSPRRRGAGARTENQRIDEQNALSALESVLGRARQGEDLSGPQFATVIEGIKVQGKQIFRLTELTGELDARESVTIPGMTMLNEQGQQVPLQIKTLAVRSLQTQFLKQLDQLKAIYRQSKRKKKTRVGGRVNNGFRLPRFFRAPIVQFFQNADLGEAIPGDPSAGLLRSSLGFVTAAGGAMAPASSSIITTLFAIYAQRRQLSALAAPNRAGGLQNRQILGADDVMQRFFGPVTDPASTFAIVRARSEQRLREQNLTIGAPKPKAVERERQRVEQRRATGEQNAAPKYRVTDYGRVFSPDNFLYSDFQSIASVNAIPRDTLAADQQALVQPLAPEQARAYQQLVSAQLEARIASERAGREAARAAGRQFVPEFSMIDWGSIAQQVAAATPQGMSQALQVRVSLDAQQELVSSALARYRFARESAQRAQRQAQPRRGRGAVRA